MILRFGTRFLSMAEQDLSRWEKFFHLPTPCSAVDRKRTRLNIKTPSYQYGSHDRLIFTMEIFIPTKMVFILKWDPALLYETISADSVYPAWLLPITTALCLMIYIYRQTSNIRPTKYQNLNISRLVLQLSLHNPLKPGVKSSPLGVAYMRHWIGSALLQIMACRLFGTKPLSKPMLDYCWLNT